MVRPDVWTIGHAGAAGEAPANTLAAVRACLASGAEAVEIDLRLCRDGVPVLMHDPSVDRTTNLSGTVRGLSLAELRQADAGEGEAVPTLDEVIDLVAGRCLLICELKMTADDADHDRELVDAVVHHLSAWNAFSWTAVHSFSPAIVAAARSASPRLPAALVARDIGPEQVADVVERALESGAQALSVHFPSLTVALVLAARRAHLTVWTWAIDERVQWQAATEAGADGIITNVPASLRAYLSQTG